MKRVLSVVVLAVATSGLCVTSAAAAPPEPAFPDGEVGVCGYPMRLDFTGKAKFIEHGGRAIPVAPGQKVTVTNLETDESVPYTIPGPVLDQFRPGGSKISGAVGRNLMFTSELGMLLTLRNVRSTVREDPTAPEGFAITVNSRKGRVTDVCAVLG